MMKDMYEEVDEEDRILVTVIKRLRNVFTILRRTLFLTMSAIRVQLYTFFVPRSILYSSRCCLILATSCMNTNTLLSC